MDDTWLTPSGSLERFAPTVAALVPAARPSGEATSAPQLLLYQGDGIEIYYAPFDHINTEARVVLVGITPSRREAAVALRVAATGLQSGAPHARILREVKREASFAGRMRRDLIQMLDDVGLATWLGLGSCAQLYTPEHERLLHNSAVLRYPVFKQGRNYTGSAPDIIGPAILRRMIDTILAPELAMIPAALIIPLGSAVERAMRLLEARGRLDPARCLHGFPHPSGANGQRVSRYNANRAALTAAVKRWFEAAGS